MINLQPLQLITHFHLKLVGLELMSQHSHDGSQFRGWDFTSSLFVDSLKRIPYELNEAAEVS